MTTRLEPTTARTTQTHRAEILAALVDAILSWGEDNKTNDAPEQANDTETKNEFGMNPNAEQGQ